MVEAARKLREISVELPDEVFEVHPWAPEEIAKEMRVLWLVEQVRQRRLGHGKAAEMAKMPRAAFLQVMGKHKVSVFDFDSDELADELSAISR